MESSISSSSSSGATTLTVLRREYLISIEEQHFQLIEKIQAKLILSYTTIEGPRTRVGQPEMKYWKLRELHKNEVKNVHPIRSICPKIWKSSILSSSQNTFFQAWGGGGG